MKLHSLVTNKYMNTVGYCIADILIVFKIEKCDDEFSRYKQRCLWARVLTDLQIIKQMLLSSMRSHRECHHNTNVLGDRREITEWMVTSRYCEGSPTFSGALIFQVYPQHNVAKIIGIPSWVFVCYKKLLPEDPNIFRKWKNIEIERINDDWSSRTNDFSNRAKDISVF